MQDKPYDVTCINPTITLGPVFTKVHTKASVSIIRQFMNGKTVFNVTTGYVDVEDVADGHVQALMREEAGGQRYIVNGVPDSLYMPRLGEIAQNLYPKYKIDASPFPPNWVLAAAKMGNMLPAFRRLAITDYEFNSLTKTFMFDNSKSISELGLKYHRLNETLQRSVDSMIQVGINPRLADNPHPKTSI
ncbi:hypothetical protein SARC_15908 [Sphaeroforma arctica JP610]|uniref:3-beta hydroxysteroid dehydrogenase/isomerase domain-containing protein n=1 Tax=Sphaeroforma arctica JP610 TaxID=667725 RepID=A0A0L0F4K4_9EUKA|nr:hypothetical protein SARC_15908 [Sphaeroforma arctica JP610]KNC71551.1 hypothetical protein SARC_15908 [Sphaeroforma arctica JP610]|eukprot:XP_014145453.1 hypothetical protein SARC_15908 [Sphaeroforma arctica JP610]